MKIQVLANVEHWRIEGRKLKKGPIDVAVFYQEIDARLFAAVLKSFIEAESEK